MISHNRQNSCNLRNETNNQAPIFRVMNKQLINREHSLYWMGIATLIILFLHCHNVNSSNDSLNKLLGYVFTKGYLGVNIFIFLSAYGCCYSFNKNTLKQFYVNRVKRLYPTMLIFMIVSYFVTTPFRSTFLIDMLGHATGLALFFGGTVFADWFVPFLSLMYICFPIIYKVTSWLYDRGTIWVAIAVIIPSFLIFIPVFYPFIFTLTLPRIGMILLGIVVYLAEQKKEITKLAGICIPLTLISFTKIIDSAFLACPVIILFASLCDMRLWGKKFLILVGKYSLEVYIAQCLFIWNFKDFGENPVLATCILLLVIITASCVLGLIHKYFWKFINHS